MGTNNNEFPIAGDFTGKEEDLHEYHRGKESEGSILDFCNFPCLWIKTSLCS